MLYKSCANFHTEGGNRSLITPILARIPRSLSRTIPFSHLSLYHRSPKNTGKYSGRWELICKRSRTPNGSIGGNSNFHHRCTGWVRDSNWN